MAQLPADRTKLTLAQQNQVPHFTAAATANINAITEAYDTIDLLNQKVDNYLANPTIADGAITSPKLADNAVITRKIANGAVTNQKIADGVITANKFVPGALTNDTQNGLRITSLEMALLKFIRVTDPKWGIVGDGVTDDTDALRAMFSEAENAIVDLCGKNFYVKKGFSLPEYCTAVGRGAKFIAELSESIPGYTGENCLFNMSSNSKIFNVELEIRTTHPLPANTQRLHINIGNFGTGEGVENVWVDGITIKGGYAGYNAIKISGQCKNIEVRNIKVPDNPNLVGVVHTTWGGMQEVIGTPEKRSPSNIVIENIQTGALSYANSYVAWISSSFNVKIRNIFSLGTGHGIVVQAGDFGSALNDPVESLFIGKNIDIENVALYNCRTYGLFVYGRATVATDNYVELPIRVKNYRAYGTSGGANGVQISYSKNARFENCFFAGFNYGFLTQNGVRDLEISHCEFTGNRMPGIAIGGSAEPPENVVIEKCDIHGNNTLEASTTGASAGLNVIYGKNIIIDKNNFGRAENETQFYGVRLENTCSLIKMSNNHTWGVADGGFAYRTSDQSNYINMNLEFYNNTAEPGIALRSGAVAKNTVDSGNKVVYQNAAPTTGTWSRGDIVYNTSPAAGGNIGWVCVESGSPGTWKSFGSIET